MKRLRHRTYKLTAVWIGAAFVGIAAVLYARLFAVAQSHYLVWFRSHSLLASAFAPFIFMLATALVRKYAPDAKGSGIPQVLEAIELASNPETAARAWKSDLVSLKTAAIKILSSAVGILGGASIGREGPTVQIASSGFAWVASKARRWLPQTDLQSYLVAGAAAGVAAAFNTPLAGITFALEEVAENAFGSFKQTVMVAVIVAGITAQAILGNYLYFGHPVFEEPGFQLLPQAILIGGLGGLFGGGFAKLLASPGLTRLPKQWWPRALVCGALCALIGLLTHGATAGSGYEVTAEALSAPSAAGASLALPFLKLATTALSYLSGMAGGIFSPSLSIGASLGIATAKLAHFSNFKACALMGMVAFFSGAVQAPLTAVIIVMEMTDQHILILSFMIAAFLGHAIGRAFLPVPLYSYLAGRHLEG